MLQGLMSVFRSKGYDGASLMELASASGLKKASLYHRFPGGKKDMTAAVLLYMETWIQKNIYEVLAIGKEPAEVRLATAINNINEIYNGGKEICMFRSLSLDTGISLFGDQIKKGITLWLEGFIQFGINLDMEESEARQKADQTFIDVQGSLVLAKSMGTTAPFKNILQQIKNRYTNT